jgi:TPR repeat protein
LYENGLGVDEDIREAVKWYRKAAEQGSATAKDNLARIEWEKNIDATSEATPTVRARPKRFSDDLMECVGVAKENTGDRTNESARELAMTVCMREKGWDYQGPR